MYGANLLAKQSVSQVVAVDAPELGGQDQLYVGYLTVGDEDDAPEGDRGAYLCCAALCDPLGNRAFDKAQMDGAVAWFKRLPLPLSRRILAAVERHNGFAADGENAPKNSPATP
jgi:hypothetical protein